MRYLLLITLLATAACADARQATPPSDTPPDVAWKDLAATLEAIVHEEMETTHLPGVAVVIVQDGKTVIKQGYGLADVATGRTVDPDRTLFRIGSVSKALTALALTRLIDGNRLSYDTDVRTYVDEITNLNGSHAPVTVWHLLTHTAGFDQIGLDRQIYDFDQPLEARKAMRPSLAAFLGAGNLRRVTPPGERFRYDTYGITLAGLLLARVTGHPYAEAMRRELFEPLGMMDSFVEADQAHRTALAIGHGWVNNAYIAQPYEVYVTTPASSIDATPADMGRLLEALTAEGANAHGRLFSKAAAAAVLAPQYRPHPRFTGITHGFWESPSIDPPDGPSVYSIGHGGSMRGFWTHFEIIPEKNVGVFIATNRNGEAGGGPVHLGPRIGRAIADALYETPPTARVAAAVSAEGRDLHAYVGEYAFGTFCQSCTPEEFARGAWAVPGYLPVSLTEGGLRVDDAVYLPTADSDVFVHQNGTREVFFGRDEAGAVSFFTTSYGPSAYERVPDMAEIRDGLAEGARLAGVGHIEKARQAVTTTLRTGLDRGLHNERTINSLGYRYLRNQNTPMAILVFAFNVAAFPDSWNVHDSLGEGLEAAGRNAEALAAYERSLVLNPESRTGKAALARLRGR